MQDATRTENEAQSVSRSASAGAMAHCLGAWAAFAALAACAQAAGVPGTQPAACGEAVVRLYPTAVVTDDEVRLADVAELEGDAARLAASWTIATAPRVGGGRVIEQSQVQQMLAQKGANLAQWVFRGASRCNVNRPKNRIAATSRPADANAGKGAGAAEAGGGEVAAPAPNSLEGVLRAYLGKKVAGLGGEAAIKFSPAAGKVLALGRPEYEFRIADRGDQPLGLVPLEVTISERGKVVQTVPMLVQVSLKKQVVVAARAINRAQRIGPEDVTLAERTFDRPDAVGASDPALFIGQQAKQPISRGDQLSAKDIEPVPLVQRNDLVTVWVRRGGVSVKGAAKAMGTAGLGQAVTLKNEGSNQTFVAVVTGPRTAEVPVEVVAAGPDGPKERVR
jgi:flagella basal body P-ring formation protein FlgA